MVYNPKVGDRVILRGTVVGRSDTHAIIKLYHNWDCHISVLPHELELDVSVPLQIGSLVRYRPNPRYEGEIVAIRGEMAFVEWRMIVSPTGPFLAVRLPLKDLLAIF